MTRWWFPNVFYFHPYLGKIPILTNIFQRGWNHQIEDDDDEEEDDDDDEEEEEDKEDTERKHSHFKMCLLTTPDVVNSFWGDFRKNRNPQWSMMSLDCFSRVLPNLLYIPPHYIPFFHILGSSYCRMPGIWNLTTTTIPSKSPQKHLYFSSLPNMVVVELENPSPTCPHY